MSAPAPDSTLPRATALLPWLAAAAVLSFGAWTGQVWEDYWITFRSSRNLVDGLGLVFQPGEKVHTFTSPLGVLLPALGYALTGGEEATIWFFRAVGALALAGTGALLVAHAREHRWPPLALGVALALGVVEAKVVAFSSNGMESALLALFTALGWRELTRPSGTRWPWLAVAYAGLMWTRPDAFLVAGAMTAGWLVFRPSPPGERVAWVRRVVPAILVGGLLYAPWFFWAWWYYGSPIPQTIIAKSALASSDLSPLRLLTAPFRCLVQNTALDGLVAPPYFYAGWPPELIKVCRLVARMAAFAWLLPGLDRPSRAASVAVLVGAVYLNQIMPYPWYYAPWTFFGGVALAGVIRIGLRSSRPLLAAGGRIAGLTAILFGIGLLLVTGTNAWHQQRLIEEPGRKQIGLWLRQHAQPGDTVFLESLGYIGYFSNLKTYDYPGLSSPEVSTLMRGGKRGYRDLIRALAPDWIVIRPHEFVDHKLGEGDALQAYDLVQISDGREAVAAADFVPARDALVFDAMYYIYRRKADAAPAPGTPR